MQKKIARAITIPYVSFIYRSTVPSPSSILFLMPVASFSILFPSTCAISCPTEKAPSKGNQKNLDFCVMAVMRSALPRHLQVTANYPLPPPSLLVSLHFSHLLRRFSGDVKGSFLDKSEVTDRVVTIIKNFQKVDPSKVTAPKAHFHTDLGLNSLDTVEVVMEPEEEFGFAIPDNEPDKFSAIDVVVDFIASHPQAK